MAVQDIQRYIEANKNQYPLEVLLDNLRKSGYPEAEIQEVIHSLNITGVALASGQGIITAWGKVWRFGLGFLVGAVVAAIVTILGYISFESCGFFCTNKTVIFGKFSLFAYPIIGVIVPSLMFFIFRQTKRYFARGILTGSFAPAVALTLFYLALISVF